MENSNQANDTAREMVGKLSRCAASEIADSALFAEAFRAIAPSSVISDQRKNGYQRLFGLDPIIEYCNGGSSRRCSSSRSRWRFQGCYDIETSCCGDIQGGPIGMDGAFSIVLLIQKMVSEFDHCIEAAIHYECGLESRFVDEYDREIKRRKKQKNVRFLYYGSTSISPSLAGKSVVAASAIPSFWTMPESSELFMTESSDVAFGLPCGDFFVFDKMKDRLKSPLEWIPKGDGIKIRVSKKKSSVLVDVAGDIIQTGYDWPIATYIHSGLSPTGSLTR